ncbi:MAG: thermonuclease family protein [Aggregatilineales bacterium]
MINRIAVFIAGVLILAGCNLGGDVSGGNSGSGGVPAGDSAQVVRVIDGDTIEVNLNGENQRVRYIGMNTPERDEVCYQEATDANRNLVEGQTVTLVRDTSDTDRFDRLLRYVYVGNTFVNWELVEQGYAEAVLYNPDDEFFSMFNQMEIVAATAGRGCHPTGIFNDGNAER